MRELLAVELRSRASTNDDARPFIDEWVLKHDGSERAVDPKTSSEATDTGAEVYVVEQTDNEEPDRRWRTEVAIGAASDTAHITVRVRIGASATASVAPINYELRTPAIVRTLIRELDISDGDIPCAADAGAEIGTSQVPALVDLLTSPRRLPVVLVSRQNTSGRILVNAGDLTRELAGLAHVRVLASTEASFKLTELVGQELSVFDGAVRVYFNGFTSESSWRDHALYFPDHVKANFVNRLRGWVGSMSAAVTPEHPAYAALREERHKRMADAPIEELREYVAELEKDNLEARAQAKAAEQDAAGLRKKQAELRYELEQVKQNYAETTLELRTGKPGAASGEIVTVADAMDAVEELAYSRYYRNRVELTPQAVKAGRKFKHYAAPEEMLRAVHAVLEAGALMYDGKLGTTPKEFFNSRGFGYGAQPSPHLKVDEATTEDQCLRIYWEVDEETNKWSISSIGIHA